MDQTPSDLDTTLQSAAALADLLERTGRKIVLAESCTAGLVSATLGSISGISDRLCGSAVTYRESVKQEWLGLDSQLLERCTAVSGEVTRAMAQAVLGRTAEADYSVAITGHLQPPDTDSAAWVFLSLGYRRLGDVVTTDPTQTWLHSPTRITRQWEAARLALQLATAEIEQLQAADRHTDFVN